MVKFERNNRIDDLLRMLVKEGVYEALDFSFIAVVYNEILNLEPLEIELMMKNYGINSPIVSMIVVSKEKNVSIADLTIKGTEALYKVINALKKKYAK